MHRQIFENFIEQIIHSNNEVIIPQQRRNPFSASIATKGGIRGFLVDQRVMPLDPFFPFEIFFFVIRELQSVPNYQLRRGDAMNNAIGQPGLELNTIEAKVAIEFYNKIEGDYIFRRISVIANILVRSGVCEHGSGVLRLKKLNISPNNNTLSKIPHIFTNTPRIPINQASEKTQASDLYKGITNSVPNFLIENGTRILNAPPQDINLITKKYSEKRFIEFPIMKEFHKTFPDLKHNTIQRKDVAKLFRKKKYYLGFITAMIWGGINASRPQKKNQFETIDFFRVLKQDKKKIMAIITKVKSLLIKGEYEKSFEYLNGDGKIDGVGHAYFTKLMYFISYNERRIKLKPLIFDKWTSNAYLALLINSGQDDKIKLFFTGRIDKQNKTVSLRKDVAKTYLSFIRDMDYWSSHLGISSSRLEEFIFGLSLKKCKAASNPRRQLWKIIMDHNK